MPTYLETWKQIAAVLARSERWCRYMTRRAFAPLPVYRIGNLVRADVADLERWLRSERERTMARSAAPCHP